MTYQMKLNMRHVHVYVLMEFYIKERVPKPTTVRNVHVRTHTKVQC